MRVTAVQPRARISEADLSGHLENGNGGADIDSEHREKADTDLQNQDSQLYEALNLLKGLTIFKQKSAMQMKNKAEKKQLALESSSEY